MVPRRLSALRFATRRLLWAIPTLLGITLFTFGLLTLAPGDPALTRFVGPETGTAAGIEAELATFRHRYLLDRPLYVQYLHYVGPFDLSDDGHEWFGGTGERPWHGLLAGDLGREYLRPSVRVADEIGRRLGVTLPLAACALVLSYLLSVPLGVLMATRRGTAVEGIGTTMLFALYAIPVFWAGLVLQMVFGATGLDWLPTIGLASPDASELGPGARAWDVVLHSVLPVACLTYGGLAYLARQMRTAMVDALGSDYVRTARAKGLPERVVVWKHALRNSLVPMVTLFGQMIPVLVGGSVLVETIFDLPGVGKYAYDAMLDREYEAVLGTTLVSAVATVFGFLVSDLLYAVVDPRIRHG